MAKKLHLGAQIYTVRDQLKYKKTFEPTLEKISKMGFKYIQISGQSDRITPEMMIETTKKIGLIVGLTHWDDEMILNNPKLTCEIHDRLGCDGIGIGGMPRVFRNYAGYTKFIKKYSPSIKKIKEYGKVFCYHNHWFEFERFKNGKTGMEILLENTDPDAFKLTLDIAWLIKAGIDPASFIEKYHDRIFAVHLKDTTVKDNEPTLTEVLNGNTSFEPILKLCKKYNIIWQFIEQDWGYLKNDSMLSLKTSRDNLIDKYGDFFD